MNNTVSLSGAISREPDYHSFDGGSRVANAQIKVARGRASDFPDIKGWDEVADALKEHGAQGNMAFIEGSIRTELYPDKNDSSKKHKSTYVQIYKLRMVDGKTGATLCEVEAKRLGDAEPAPEASAV